MNCIERNPIKTLLVVMVLLFTALEAITDTATIETINGVKYVTEINSVSIDARRPNRYDLELKWEYK